MRCVTALLVILALVAPASAVPSHRIEFTSREAILAWIWRYRVKADPARVPAAIKAMSETGAFKDPDTAGVYIGFIAGDHRGRSVPGRAADRQVAADRAGG